MRDAATTALEVVGMISVAVAVGLTIGAAAGFAIAGLVLISVGALEGRKR